MSEEKKKDTQRQACPSAMTCSAYTKELYTKGDREKISVDDFRKPITLAATIPSNIKYNEELADISRSYSCVFGPCPYLDQLNKK